MNNIEVSQEKEQKQKQEQEQDLNNNYYKILEQMSEITDTVKNYELIKNILFLEMKDDEYYCPEKYFDFDLYYS